jgi:hypothetical protein
MELHGAAYYYSRITFGELSRVVYGNNAKLTNNVGPRRELRRLRASQPVRPHLADSAAAGARLWEQGYLIHAPTAGPAVLDKVREGYSRVIDDPARSRDLSRFDQPDVLRHVVEPATNVPAVRDLLTPCLLDVVRAFYRAPFQLLHVRLWRIAHAAIQASQDEFGNLWHTDEHPVTLLKLFVQLNDDVAETGAALQLHPVSSTRQVMRRGYFHQKVVKGPARQLLEDPSRVVRFDQPAGTALFCSTPRVLHRAGNPAPGTTRAMLQFTFGVAAGPVPDDLFAGLQPDVGVLGAVGGEGYLSVP